MNGQDISARKKGAVQRIFFALTPPQALRDAVAQLGAQLAARPGGSAVRWTPPGNYHITLCFLGNVANDKIAELEGCVAEALAGAEPFAFHLGAPRAFPSAARPRVVVLHPEPPAKLSELAQRVQRGAVRCGVPPGRDAFSAHLTLGRLRARRLPELEAPAPAAEAWRADCVTLLRSDLGESGPSYHALTTIPLGFAMGATSSHHPHITPERLT